MKNLLTLTIAAAFVLTAAAPPPVPAGARPAVTARAAAREKFRRTELYFGTAKPGGGIVTPEEWRRFLNDEVTPRFPDGLTVLEGYGQYREKSGAVVREESRVLVLLYPKKLSREVHRKIEEIRTLYKRTFAQESVLRVDFRASVEVGF